MMTHPGKKLNFMGNELAMFREWDESRELDWELLRTPTHDAFHRYITELNRIYLEQPALFQLDHTYDGFKWVNCGSDNANVFGYTRTGKESSVIALFNFSDVDTAIAPEWTGNVELLLNTDWEPYGGKTQMAFPHSIPQCIPPYCGLLFQVKD